MFYRLLKLYARLTIRIYCRKIVINQPEVLHSRGPLLLAANHPNSFLDGILITTLFDRHVYSLTRGDAFANKWVSRFLYRLRLLPVYRSSEGTDKLEHNYATFEACRKTFEQHGIVLIFSEGRCENEWHLRPLKKGTARLAITSWQRNIPLKVIPLAFNYSSFKKFGKEVHIFFGKPILPHHILEQASEGKQLLAFNEELYGQLSQLVYEIDPGDKERIRTLFSSKRKPSFYWLLLPALAGWLMHFPLFYLCKALAYFFRRTGHYDSVLTASLMICYPFYLPVLFFAAFRIEPLWSLSILLSPVTAWACVQVKYQLDM